MSSHEADSTPRDRADLDAPAKADLDAPAKADLDAPAKADLGAAEKKVTGEIDPGARAVVVAVAVLVLLGSIALPHSGAANGWDVLTFAPDAQDESIALPSRLFVGFALAFGVVASMLALVTRRWALAWVALAGTAVSVALGMLAIWSRQTTAPDLGASGPGIGLVLGWLTVIVLTFHWVKVVWSKTAAQLEAEEARRRAAAEQEQRDAEERRRDG
ncbi:hypothetical protein [Rhodococcus sp. HNM0569]|uniref:Rv2732c family membrane protein n=1 Tax=Rhodococcus sp. HNM0569 TaxID=2716340 RepID=UPI00146C32DD|nr:hypothetical protein [Rhodococcus sp. HNM0569]NLU81428.1 hypothetical protein [Rhodococcus sp. HNM0569]